MTRLLGAVLAGGRSTRFGSDKAVALLAGTALLDHVAAALRPQVEALAVCGRDCPGLTSLADRPAPDLGPLGGLAAALHYAEANGFDAVLTAACDVVPVPADLVVRLAPADAAFEAQPLFGLWQATRARELDAYLARGGRSVHGWIDASGARRVTTELDCANINTRADLERAGGQA